MMPGSVSHNSSDEHPQWCLSIRKVVLSNLLWRPFFDAIDHDVIGPRDRHEIVTWITAKIDGELLEPKDNVSLEQFLSALWYEYDKCVAGFGTQRGELKALGDSLRNAIAAVSCGECIKKAGTQKICYGDVLNDRLNVARSGVCFEPVAALFSFVKDMCRRIYTDYIDQCDTRIEPAINMVRLSTIFCNGLPRTGEERKVHKLSNDLKTGARTVLEDTKGAHNATIELKINALGFDRRDYASLCYLFFHEIICHAYQGACQSGIRNDSDEDCPFSEGWMDYVAFLVCVRSVGSCLTRGREGIEGAILGDNPELRRLMQNAAVEYHESRYKEGKKYRDSSSAARITGRRAAFKLVNAHETLYGDKTEAEEYLIRFSLLYNVLDVPGDKRSDIPLLIRKLCMAEEMERRCLETINRFLETADVKELHNELNTLQGPLKEYWED